MNLRQVGSSAWLVIETLSVRVSRCRSLVTPLDSPLSPALLAVESGARLYVAAVIREPRGAYTGYIREIHIPEDGDRMARTRVALAGIAAAFEELIMKAPEQWWTLFYPIWDDLRV